MEVPTLSIAPHCMIATQIQFWATPNIAATDKCDEVVTAGGDRLQSVVATNDSDENSVDPTYTNGRSRSLQLPHRRTEPPRAPLLLPFASTLNPKWPSCTNWQGSWVASRSWSIGWRLGLGKDFSRLYLSVLCAHSMSGMRKARRIGGSGGGYALWRRLWARVPQWLERTSVAGAYLSGSVAGCLM